MDEETYAQIPDEMTVRELRFKVEQPGFRVDNVVLVTTMLDATMYTKDELADLYLQRWNVELDLRAIKDVLQMDVLRCKSPELVEKEIWMHLLAYNLIRGVMFRLPRHTKSGRGSSASKARCKRSRHSKRQCGEQRRRIGNSCCKRCFAQSHNRKSVIDLVERNLAPTNAVPRHSDT